MLNLFSHRLNLRRLRNILNLFDLSLLALKLNIIIKPLNNLWHHIILSTKFSKSHLSYIFLLFKIN
jgi:hypothetical protein